MANRSIQAKLLKMKRRKRFAVFSGSSVKALQGDATKVVEYLEHEGMDKVRVKQTRVYVGVVSFSKQVVNTGRGPNAERMKEYYDRVPKENAKTLAEYFNITKDKRYAQLWWETPPTNKVNLVEDGNNRLDLYFHGAIWFFVHIDFRKQTIIRSRDYGSRAFAMDRLQRRCISWVEQIPMSSALK